MCTVTEGRSVKESETAGGSFGLSKNAPFAMSSLGVVCYATRLPRGPKRGGGKPNTRSVAKCRVISHKMSGAMLQHVGGLESYEQFLARPGTSITVVGTAHIVGKKAWRREFENAVRRNFFIAVADGELECEVAGNRVRVDGLEKDAMSDKRKAAPSYMDAVRMYMGGGSIPVQSGGLSFDVWIEASAHDDAQYSNQCMYVNRRGMLITGEASSRRNPFHVPRQSHGSFLALVRSSDDDTEKQMRAMEPPSHAEIDISRSPERRQALREVRNKIEMRIRDILFADSDQDDVTELAELADLLPIKRDSGTQTDLDAFVRKPGGRRAGAGVVVPDKTGGQSKGEDSGAPSRAYPGQKAPRAGESDGAGLNEIRMTGRPDGLSVYGTLSGCGGRHPVNIAIRRVSESREHDEDGARLPIKNAGGALVGAGGAETAVRVDTLEGSTLAITAPGASGKRLRLDITLDEMEPVRCAYEVVRVP